MAHGRQEFRLALARPLGRRGHGAQFLGLPLEMEASIGQGLAIALLVGDVPAMADIADDPPAFVLERRLERAQPTQRAVQAAGRLLHDRRLGVREELLLVGREPGRDLRRIELAVVAADQVGSRPGTHDSCRRCVGGDEATLPVLGENEVRQSVDDGPVKLVLLSRTIGA